MFASRLFDCDTLGYHAFYAEGIFPVRERLSRNLMLIALVLGLAAIVIAGINRLEEFQSATALTATPQVEAIIRLPYVVSEVTPYPYPQPPDPAELQAGSIDLIIGAFILVSIIVGGVIYGKDQVPR